MMFVAPSTFVLTASIGLYSQTGTCFNAAAWIMFGLITYDHERDIYLIGKAITKLAQRELEEERLAENTLQ